MNTIKSKNSFVPYHVIVLAAGGDVDAINTVISHFAGYITALATRQLYDEDGNPYLCVDEGLRRRLETKLITAILTFDAA